MRRYDHTTQPVDTSFRWDPTTIFGQSLTAEPWIGYTNDERINWLAELNSESNDRVWVSKMTEWRCFCTIILRGDQMLHKFIVLENFQRFIEGPTFEGPHN